MIEEEVDAELGRMALAEGTSKAELIRRFVKRHIRPLPPIEKDPLYQMAGRDSFDPEPIDDVVYR